MPVEPKPFSAPHPTPPRLLRRRGTLLNPSAEIAIYRPSSRVEKRKGFATAVREAASIAHRILSLPRTIRFLELSLSAPDGSHPRSDLSADLLLPPSASTLVDAIRSFIDTAEFVFVHTWGRDDWAFILPRAYCEVYISTGLLLDIVETHRKKDSASETVCSVFLGICIAQELVHSVQSHIAMEQPELCPFLTPLLVRTKDDSGVKVVESDEMKQYRMGKGGLSFEERIIGGQIGLYCGEILDSEEEGGMDRKDGEDDEDDKDAQSDAEGEGDEVSGCKSGGDGDSDVESEPDQMGPPYAIALRPFKGSPEYDGAWHLVSMRQLRAIKRRDEGWEEMLPLTSGTAGSQEDHISSNDVRYRVDGRVPGGKGCGTHKFR